MSVCASSIGCSEVKFYILSICLGFHSYGNTQAMLLRTKKRKIMESGCDVSLVNDPSYDQPIHEINPSLP